LLSGNTAQSRKQFLLLRWVLISLVILASIEFLVVRLTRNSKPTLNQASSAATNRNWERDPSTIIIEYSYPLTGPIVYDSDQLLPNLRIWGDGRIVWLSGGVLCSQREMSEGYLSESEIMNALQMIQTSGFWEQPTSRFTGSSAPDLYLSVSLLDRQYTSYPTSELRSFFGRELIEQVTDPHQYAPAQGRLSVGVCPNCTEYCEECQSDPSYSSSIGELIIPSVLEVGEACVTGEVLEAAYEKQSENPCSPQYIVYQSNVYQFSLIDLDACNIP
jgi:hypothetical protein